MARTRQLTAILFARIEGYSTLIQQSESEADQIKADFRKIVHSITGQKNGKVLQQHGGRILTIFSSAIEAVQGAIDMQHVFMKEGSSVAVKIGIHLGEIIYSDEEVIGAGVEIASNMASKAPAGSILVSGKIYDEVKTHGDIQTQFVYSCCLDETDQPVEVYAISNQGLVLPEQTGTNSALVLEENQSGNRLQRFWNELKRRKVIRVVTVYAASAYVILEFEDIVEDDLGLPDWTGLLLIILLSTGLVLTAVLSWVYDITPEGIRKTQDENGRFPPFLKVRNDRAREYEVEGRSWFKRNRVLKRYLLPLTLFALVFLVFRFWDPLFNNPYKLKEQALIHATNANIYFNNSADVQTIKGELDLALSLDSSCASALNTYGMVYLAEGDTTLATQLFHRATRSDSTFANAWSNLASIAAWKDNYDLAMDYTIRAVASDPKNATAAYNMAIQSWDRGFSDQAVEWFRKALQMDSAFTQASSALGALYNELQRPSDAILVLQKSLKLAPQSDYNFLIYKNLAEAYYQLKQYDRALGYLGQSKTLAPEFPATEKCYARLYEASGETDLSIQHWQRYMILEQDSILLLQAQQHLDSLHSGN